MARSQKNIIEYRFYEFEPDKSFRCLSGDEWRISDVLSDRLHFHNCLEIGYCLSDHGFLGFENDVTVPFQAGDIFLIPRFVPHTTCSSQGQRSLWNYLFIDPDVLARNLGIPGNMQNQNLSSMIGSYLHVTRNTYPRLYFLCQCLLEEGKRWTPDDPGMFTLYSMTMSAELLKLAGMNKRSRSDREREFVLSPALEYINVNYAEACNVEKLAALCHLSQTHFRRLFQSVMGCAPLQYVIQIRIRQACILLNTTNEPITNIAQAVGINSISSFNRNFQQIMDVSPQQYRSCSMTISNHKCIIEPYKGWLVPETLL